jgi:hypothetical protein
MIGKIRETRGGLESRFKSGIDTMSSRSCKLKDFVARGEIVEQLDEQTATPIEKEAR